MDFNDTPEDGRYRAKARTWLLAHAPKSVLPRRVRGVETSESLLAAKSWQTKKAHAGYACITWPQPWGGPGGTAIQSVIFAQEEAMHAVPSNPFHIGLSMCMPTVLTYSDEAARPLLARPAMHGEKIWCQLFSEPGAGSDLAGGRTRGERASDQSSDWIVNGQKVWTTGAHISDFGLLLSRTDPNVPKHKGLTMFWLDMKSPGVEVRPIVEMNGVAGFNEVYFTNVCIPDAQRLGGVGEGWKVALFTLMNERLAADQTGAGWADFMELARRTPGLDGKPALADPAVREKLADWYVELEGLKHTRNRTITALARGQSPGPENSIIKLVRAGHLQSLSHAAVELLDRFGIIDDPTISLGNALFHSSLLWSSGLRIAGGTDEILRNIIAERVLGLPGDVRVDKDIAFRDVPNGR